MQIYFKYTLIKKEEFLLMWREKDPEKDPNLDKILKIYATGNFWIVKPKVCPHEPL